jgi:hypothetical protein
MTGPRPLPRRTRQQMTILHPLAARILAVRRHIATMEAEAAGSRWSNPRRQEIRNQSLFLDGLEEAAELALSAEQRAPLATIPPPAASAESEETP